MENTGNFTYVITISRRQMYLCGELKVTDRSVRERAVRYLTIFLPYIKLILDIQAVLHIFSSKLSTLLPRSQNLVLILMSLAYLSWALLSLEVHIFPEETWSSAGLWRHSTHCFSCWQTREMCCWSREENGAPQHQGSKQHVLTRCTVWLAVISFQTKYESNFWERFQICHWSWAFSLRFLKVISTWTLRKGDINN